MDNTIFPNFHIANPKQCAWTWINKREARRVCARQTTKERKRMDNRMNSANDEELRGASEVWLRL